MRFILILHYIIVFIVSSDFTILISRSAIDVDAESSNDWFVKYLFDEFIAYNSSTAKETKANVGKLLHKKVVQNQPTNRKSAKCGTCT